jgi:hypothetical protein
MKQHARGARAAYAYATPSYSCQLTATPDCPKIRRMRERAFMGADRRIWLVRPRPTSRRGEVGTHVTLELMTDGETRVVTCRQEEWDTLAPDFAALLARSLPGGASRGITRRVEEASPLEPD